MMRYLLLIQIFLNYFQLIIDVHSEQILKLCFDYKTDQTDYSVLLEQTLKITTLEMESDEGDIEKFLNKCPLIQNLTLNGHKKEVGRIILKDLRKLEFVDLQLFQYHFFCN